MEFVQIRLLKTGIKRIGSKKMNELPKVVYELVNERGFTTKLEHLSALFHGWMIETGFESKSIQHGQAGGRIELIYNMHNIQVIVQLLPIGGDIVRVKAHLTIPNDSTILESFSLSDSVRVSSIVADTSGDDRFNLREVAEVKIRFKDEVALPAKHRVCNELNLPPPSDSILGLPDEILLMIAKRIPPADDNRESIRNTVQLGRTCKRMDSLMKDQLLWKSLYARDFKESYKKLKDNEGSLSNVEDWKQEYANMYKRNEPKTSGVNRLPFKQAIIMEKYLKIGRLERGSGL